MKEAENFLLEHFKLGEDYIANKLKASPLRAEKGSKTGRIFITPAL